MRQLLFLLALVLVPCLQAQTSPRLTGTPIGSELSYDYSTNRSSTTANRPAEVFDDDTNTFFASYQRSYGWVGLDFGEPCVVTGLAWAARNVDNGPKRTELGVFEGANREDFLDAVPLYLVTAKGKPGEMFYTDVEVSRGFRYVRYVGPNDSRCNIAELAFYGLPDAGTDSLFYQPTNLPVVTIHVADEEVPRDKTTELSAYVSIISRQGAKILADTCTIRLRGNASKDFPKKPYRIKFDQKHHVLGSPAKAKKWTLINNYGDKTLMRNILAFDLSRRVGLPYTPFCEAVDVILNGEYKGCYQLCDQVEVHKGRVEIDEMDPRCTSGDDLTGGYFVEVDAYANGEPCYFYSSRSNPVTIKSPDSDSILSVQKNYIRQAFNDLETSLFASNFTDVDDGYRSHLDLDSFLRHFLVGEFSGNTDTYWSTYMTKPRMDDRFYFGPVWDFDLAYENDNRTYPICQKSDFIYASRGSYAGQMRSFVNRIIKHDDAALRQLEELWAELRMSRVFSEDSLLAVVDYHAAQLEASQQLNFQRWPIMNSYVHQNPKIWGSYEAEVRNVRDYIVRRLSWMDRKLNFDPEQLGIDRVEADADALLSPDGDTPVFDLMGRRRHELRPGLNIVNGQKILVR